MSYQSDLGAMALNTHPAMLVSGYPTPSDTKRADGSLPHLGVDYTSPAQRPVTTGTEALRIAWVDTHSLTQECIMAAFIQSYPRLLMFPFNSIDELIAVPQVDVDFIVYHAHALDAACLQDIATMKRTFEGIPLIVLSDVDDVHHGKIIRAALQSGAHGFISTRTTSISMAVAAIRFVNAGGTFAPVDLLLPDRVASLAEKAESAPANRLTHRQMAVLSHLQQGKANKIIAHELGMSESTVKVHVRNIMRKMGATNRTQAAFKAQKIWSAPEFRLVAEAA
jgi:DNA-binding NarL/FixJ family response regulator